MSCIYEVEIRHVRTEPVRHEVRHRSYLWYVDVDALPRLPRALRPLARFSADRAAIDALLAEHGVDLRGGRITMLAHARSLGYVFNPLTLFWCHDPSGALACVVAEVHNTYGQRHSYVLRVDDAGRAETAKQFYVSPFYPVDGHYRMSVPEPGERLALTVTLHRPGEPPFVATVRGVRRQVTTRSVLRMAVRHPFETQLVRALITRHGIALWLKGLPVQPRPSTPGASMPTTATQLAELLHTTTGRDLPVRLRAWDGSEAGPADGPVLVVRSRRALRRLLWAPGELGLARAYVSGDLDVDGDLAEGFRRVWATNAQRVELSPAQRLGAVRGAVRLGVLGPPPAPPSAEARLSGRLHTQRRDRDAIAHHYDLSNEFYELLLDETMAYSCGYYAKPGMAPAEAQRAKLDLICAKLGLSRGARLLDVGCGWGALLVHAAEHYGVEAVGVTLSAQQRDFVAKRIADAGLSDRVQVRLQDYRDLPADERYDAVSSIEMGEHVGEGQYPVYAATLFGALRPGGRLLLQQMSRRADAAPGGGAFIESYIAPDMHMRPLPATLAHLERAGFEIRSTQGMREHYVRTVQAWLDTLAARREAFVDLVGEEVVRVWQLYLAGGALSFEQGRMGVDQVLAERPDRG